MNIAITAASGQLGSAIVNALLDINPKENIIALARTPENAKALGVEVRSGDYNNSAQLAQSLQTVDVLLLVSGMDAPDKRIQQHRNVIHAAKTAGVKKIVYTSVQGAEENTAFSPVIQSNRQTEQDIRESGVDWVIGRNGIYIEPDIEYIDSYKKSGVIANCANNGKCGYTTRSELAYAYARMLTESKHNGQTYNLHGESMTQYQLADYMNLAFGTSLIYTPMTVEEYQQDRVAELGDFIGTVIAGIYQGILEGKADNPSHFNLAAGRAHISWDKYFTDLKQSLA
ncbi:SDR family oxidoreductase [Shewanella sp. 1_MG-2023]|uniref:SDR family oxidoreductase n=1 Tax=unclassified Shewanella TaxID=196818 RepID=UPI0026E2C218|nr:MULTISPECIES: SDR family oxidoreductase [unclassified Shewanella]MDO6613555.1 SDR family oxidoreductase [Shewanella sp. 7_MG-2023]MDO6773385.1 SDR family oxidoreductase [Shewanella sp. 2_MG-2023]MDO6796036.1 SDR family oxidoreductase [Shewanella sp. 1_MG-2023]